ncbi:MAG: hypothetical protein AAF570_25890 [Bacteroidota bacterium]
MQDFQFSAAERSVLSDAAFFRHKASADAKVQTLLHALRNRLQALPTYDMPPELLERPGRTFRGENYKGLPWRAFDWPRHSAGQDLFIFRGLLLWGEHFSFHLLLQGAWLPRLARRIVDHQEILADLGFRRSHQSSLWEWEFDASTHSSLIDVDGDAILADIGARGLLKLSVRIPLSQLETVPERGAALWAALCPMMFTPF